MDDAEKPVFDSAGKLDNVHLEETAHHNAADLSHTWSGKLHSLAGFVGHVSTQAKTGHSHAALGSGAHALLAF